MARHPSTTTNQRQTTPAVPSHLARLSLPHICGRAAVLSFHAHPSPGTSDPFHYKSPSSVGAGPGYTYPSTAGRRTSLTSCAGAGGSMGAGAADPGDAAASQRHVGHGVAAAPQSRSTAFLAAINDLTKWAVSAAVFAVLLVRRDLAVAWCVLGSIIASFLNKALKYIINEQRPPSARKADPGMPSSHANSLAFLGVYTALVLAPGPAPLTAATGPGAAAAVLALSLFLTWLRVRLGYHTTPQVLVGYGLGAATAAAWHHLGARHALKALAARPEQRLALYGCTAVAVALFAVRNVLAWFKEREGAGLGKAAMKAA